MAYCTCCKVTEAAAKLPDRIRKGFTIDRYIKGLRQLFEELVDKDVTDVNTTHAGDYCRRFGLTNRPQTTQDIIRHYPITHAWIRILCHFKNCVYWVNAKVRTMGRRQRIDNAGKQAIKAAKNKFRIGAQQGPMHLKLDCSDSTGAWGSTDTAGLAGRFFEAKNCQHFLDLVDGPVAEKAAFEKLHQNFAVILRIVSSKERLVEVDAFEQLCIETTLVLVEAFPWASFPRRTRPLCVPGPRTHWTLENTSFWPDDGTSLYDEVVEGLFMNTPNYANATVPMHKL
jgi:hypothetical protein